MNSLPHSLTCRAPPATRNKLRWQPYCSSITPPSPPATHLNTPSIYSPTRPSIELIRPPKPPSLKPASRSAKDLCPRDIFKNKFALALVDQAVMLLCEIWRSQDIPSVFVSHSKSASTCRDIAEQKLSSQRHISQLHSPLSPSPLRASSSTCTNDADQQSPSNNLLPIKGFVHEVLRRSRTSGCVLQTALCYLDALRPKIPELVRKEKAGEAGWKELELADRIIVAADADIQQHAEEGLCLENIIHTDQCSAIDPMPSTQVTAGSDARLSDFPLVAGPSDCIGVPAQTQPESFQFTTDRLSPLLCPRRSFLAALILASKFLQDKCYSNRAWAKLSGLSPKEIGRCERALGQALDWRLWVGKLPVPPQPTPAPVHRSLHRTQSESCLRTLPSSENPPFTARNESLPTHTGSDRSLRRSSTLPASAFDSSATSASTHGDIAFDVLHSIPVPLPAIIGLIDTKEASPGSQSSTPSLVYSPTSTDSSSGSDRTAQQELDEMCTDSTLPTAVQNVLTPFSVVEQIVINPYTRKGGVPDMFTTPTLSVDNLSVTAGYQGGYLRRQEESIFLDFGV